MTQTSDAKTAVPRDGQNEASAPQAERHVSRQSRRGVDGLNFFLADVQTGVGPFLAIYLATVKWDTQRVGIALFLGSFAGIIAQTPAGELIDRTHRKRWVIGVGVIALAMSAIVIAFFPSFVPVIGAQMTIGAVSSVFVPGVAAITLGLVGRGGFDRRQGRNQTFNAAGNVTAAVAMGLLGYFVSDRAIFFFVAAMIVPTLFFVKMINPAEIDHNLASGCQPGESPDRSKGRSGKPARFIDLLRDKRVLVFLICCVLFHFANAAMLPLLGEMLSRGKGATSMAFMSACVVTTQLVITCIAAVCGRLAGGWGRKPLLIIGFGCLPVRGVLYTMTDNVYALVSIQILDGVAAGIFGVVSVLVIADLMSGTGRFNVAQGAIATAVGIGASLSQLIAGAIVHHAGNRAGFLFLAAVAAGGWLLLLFAMPETKDGPSPHIARPD